MHAPSPEPPLHEAAAVGFEAAAATYVAGRPEYPEAALDWLVEDIGLEPGRVVVDLGAGTGKFTKLVVRTGASLIAVEPVAAMRDQLRKQFPDAEVREGRAEALPLEDASVDAIVCAQAFHWFATPEALAEFRRALKVGGRLGLIWNVRDESVGWVAKLTELLDRYRGDTPRHESGRWRDAFPAEGFSPLTEQVFAHCHVGPPERVIVDRSMSTSFIAVLPREEQEKVAAAVRKIIAGAPELAGRETVTFPYVTRAYACERVD